MKMKKILFILCFFIMIFIPFNNVYAYSSENYDPGSNGDGLDTSSYSDYCNTTNGCVHNERGIRVTLVNNRGVQISGTHFVDFWDTVPINARAKSGTKYRSYYVNNSGNGLYGDGTTERGTYTSIVDATNDLSLVGGSISYSNQHELIEGVIREELAAYKISKNCSEFKFFEKFGYSNFCNDIKANDCDEKLSKIYVLIEPVYYVNYNKKNVVLTATELIAKIYKTRIIQGDTQKTYNLNKAAFDNAMTNMFLTSEDDKYEFYKSGKAKKKYNTFDQYAGDLQDINISEYYNSSTEHQEILKASIGLSSKYTPLGNSMHLVWLGVFSKDYCYTPKCCIPCDEGEKICKEKYGENFYSEDPACCYADMITNEKGVCVSKNKYWKGKEKPSYCKPPDKENPPSTCNPSSITPEFILGVCTEDDSETMSYFRDGVFNSENGLLKNYNTYEKLTTVGMGFLEKDDDGKTVISENIFDLIAKQDGDNTYQAVIKSNDSRYVTKINDYCSIACQEIFDVTLPENKPVVNAGRYFRWHIKDSEADIAKASGAKLCAVDIDLDKAIDMYLHYSQGAKMAAINEENFRCDKSSDKIGVGGKLAGAEYETCDEFKVDYVYKDLCDSPVEDGMSYPTIERNTEEKCDCDENGENCDTWFEYSNFKAGQEARQIVYDGQTIYKLALGNPPETYKRCGQVPPLEDKGQMFSRENVSTVGDVLTPNHYAPGEWCEKTKEDYDHFLGNAYYANVSGIYNSIIACNEVGKSLSQKYDINMGVELNYQTLFNTYTYSTESSNDENKIVKYNESFNFVDGRKCIELNGKTKCREDLNGDGWDETPFYVDNQIRKFTNNNNYYNNISHTLGCGGNWDVIGNKDDSVDPKFDPNNANNPGYPTMVCSDWYEYNKLNQYGELKNAGKYMQNIYCIDGNFKFYDEETGENYWNSIYLGLATKETYYKLDDAINACICKEGYVTNLVNGECICEREVSYYDFTSNYSNYQKLDDGTLTVEFMNGSGLYPISLKYWTLGNVLNGIGHFDSIATNIEYSKNVPPKICSEEGDKTVCTYGDPDGVCRYVIKNRIIAHPDDKTDCDDGPCVPCEDEPCGPEPTVTCIDDDGSINEECRDLAGLNVIYRVVDLNDPFPEGRSPGTNWIGKEGVITDNRGVSGMQLYSSSEVEPLYSFELTPAVIKEIRRDTANLDPAKKYTVGTVVYQNGETTGGYSLFIHHTLSKYGTINLEDDKDNRFEAIIKTGSTIDWGE